MIDGSDIVGAVLTGVPAMTNMVPAAQIKAGRLPDDCPLPALLVRIISTVERTKLRRVGAVRVVDRVSVTVRAGSHRDRKTLGAAVVACLAGRTGEVGGGARVAIVNAGSGPEVDGPGNSYERSHDFRVSYETVLEGA
ncbi:MAG: hypothetical protein U5M50_02270 [Sphingobium sp.]|nr:hypothetical protein [Sphingobium sp.]